MRPHLPALTSVRFLAALYVLVVHFGQHLFNGTPLASFAYMGSSGVSMFFVLSGFILTYTYAGRPVQPGRFWWARFARIWPVYLLSLALSLEIYWPRFQAYLAASGDSAWHVILRFVTGTQTWALGDALALTGAINNPSWSISTEVFFYLLFPLLLPLASRLSPRTLLLAAVGAWALLILPAWLVSYGVDLGVVTRDVVYKNPAFRLGEFILGIAAGLVFLKRPEWARTPRLAWLSWLLAVVLLAYGLRAGLPRLALVSGAMAPAFALVVLTLAARGGPARWLEWRPLVFLGEASYAFYLAHYPVALYLQRAGLRIGTDAHFWATLAVTLVVSVLAFVLVERPARAWLRGVIVARRALVQP